MTRRNLFRSSTAALAAVGTTVSAASTARNEAGVPLTHIRRVRADGINVFYREAGPADAPVILLLHGFPASSFQYRELIPRLGDRYRVIAPDLPGFGFTAAMRIGIWQAHSSRTGTAAVVLCARKYKKL